MGQTYRGVNVNVSCIYSNCCVLYVPYDPD